MQETRDDSEGPLHYIASMLMKPQNMELCTGMTQISTTFRATFYKMTTLMLERDFNYCRSAAKLNPKGAFGAEAVWHQLVYGCQVMDTIYICI